MLMAKGPAPALAMSIAHLIPLLSCPRLCKQLRELKTIQMFFPSVITLPAKGIICIVPNPLKVKPDGFA